MARDALRNHPVFPLMYTASSMYRVFWSNLRGQADLYGELHNNCLDSALRLNSVFPSGVPNSSFNRRFNTREYSATLTPSGFARSMLPELYDRDGHLRSQDPLAPDRRDKPLASVFERLPQSLISVHSLVFRTPGWTLGPLAAGALSG